MNCVDAGDGDWELVWRLKFRGWQTTKVKKGRELRLVEQRDQDKCVK